MARTVDHEQAHQILKEEFSRAEQDFVRGKPPNVPSFIQEITDVLMQSATQAYREALIGCALARLVDPEIDIQQPTTTLGENSFSGRSLDENVVNPFLQLHEIPSSKSPYLSALRRGVELRLPVPPGQRDHMAFEALVRFLEALQEVDDDTARVYLRYLLYAFLRLREESQIELVRVQQLNVDQYRDLLADLLRTPSGGRIPLMVVVAMFKAIEDYFELGWEIDWQDINAADAPSNVPGDVTIRRNGTLVLSVEVTERQVEEERVRTTFRTKISPQQVKDYVFLSTTEPSLAARERASQYFAQGHHIGFLSIHDWAVNLLATIGPAGRQYFNQHLVELLDHHRTPKHIKVAWNQALESVIT